MGLPLFNPCPSALSCAPRGKSDYERGNPAGPYTVDNSLTQAILKLAADEEKNTGQRLLDCVDMHYLFLGAGLGDTRALWDLTFTQYNTPALAMYRNHDGMGRQVRWIPDEPQQSLGDAGQRERRRPERPLHHGAQFCSHRYRGSLSRRR